jgi:hypothetical protein
MRERDTNNMTVRDKTIWDGAHFMLGQLCPSRRRHRDAQSGIYPREDCNRTRPGSAMDEAETKTPHFNADGGSTEERAGDIAVR